MRKISKFYRSVDASALGAGLAFVGLTEQWFDAQNIPGWLVWVIVALLIGAFVRIFRVLAVRAVNRSQRVRRVILGADFIEGVWFDVLHINGELFCALITVYIRDGKYSVVGKQFDANGDLIVTWTSITSVFDGNTLHYLYRAHYNRLEPPEERQGISIWNFSRASGSRAPISFSGYFVDMVSGFRSEVFTGRKLNKSEVSDLENPTGEKDLISKLMREHELAKSPTQSEDVGGDSFPKLCQISPEKK